MKRNCTLRKDLYGQALKYGAVGVVNTLLTYFTFVLLRKVGAGLAEANVTAFALGMACSFALNKFWTFRSHDHRLMREALFFAIGGGVCWSVQWAAFHLLLTWLPENIAMIGGMGTYTLTNFLFNKFITFNTNKPA